VKISILNQIHTALLFASFSAIITLSVLSSFADSGNLPLIIKSPFYIIPWFFLTILIIVRPWIIEVPEKSLLSYFIRHIPFVLLFFAVFIAMMTDRKKEISLMIGEIVNLNDLKSSLLFKEDMNIELKLDDFNIERHSKKDKSIKSYKSEITLTNNDISNVKKNSVRKIIEVNKPLKIGNLKIYQKSWSLGINEIKFKINNTEYGIMDQKESIIKIRENKYFELFPSDITGKKILYKWNIKNESGLPVDSGFFINEKDFNNKFPPDEFDFMLLEEDFKIISIFEITYKRANLFLGFAAVFFILMMFMDFFGFNMAGKIFKI